MQKPLLAPFYLIAAALIGIGDTAFLSYFAFLNAVPGCAIGGCEQVLTSVYSKFYSIPLAYIGLFYYVGMLGLAILLAVKPYTRLLIWGTALYTLDL